MRALVSLGGALGITFLLFLAMQLMIGVQDKKKTSVATLNYSDFVHDGTSRQVGDANHNANETVASVLQKLPKLQRLPQLPLDLPDVTNADLDVMPVSKITPEINLQEMDLLDSVQVADPVKTAQVSDKNRAAARKGGGSIVHNPLTVKRVSPKYPRRARKLHIHGSVKLKFLIMPDGSVRNVEVIKATPKGYFEKASIRAIKKWVFQPSLKNGVPVSQLATQTIVFRLNS